MKFASISTLLISSSFASLAGAQTVDCSKAAAAPASWGTPSNPMDPSTYSEAYCAEVASAISVCDGTGDAMDKSTADTFKAFSGMCDSSSCDYKYSTALVCLAAIGTTENVDSCCTDNGVAAACEGVTTYMNTPCEGACPWDTIETSCDALSAGGATTAISGLAMAAAGAAILNNVL